MKIQKSSGTTQTEKILSELCENTFLKLWSYPNLYKKDKKELCDLLVVFENHVFIFSDKEIKYKETRGTKTAWKAWKRKAIDKQIKQIKVAEKYIKKNPNEIFLDNNCNQRCPAQIPNSSDIIFHRIIVANGIEKACKAFSSDNLHGSLAISYSESLQKEISFPFFIELEKNKIFHVLDSYNLTILLKELDTFYDFSMYLKIKEEAIGNLLSLTYCGEEDLLAMYFQNFDESKNEHSILPKDFNGDNLHIGEGMWDDFCKSKVYERMKKANINSYTWDKIIQKTITNSFNGTLIGHDIKQDNNSAIHEMAKEPRFSRRAIVNNMTEAINLFPEDFDPSKTFRHIRVIPSFYNDKMYVFLQLNKDPEKDFEKEYRPLRLEILEVACGLLKNKMPNLNKVIGLAIAPPKLNRDGNSEDFLLIKCDNWSQEQVDLYNDLGKIYNLFNSKNMSMWSENIKEFPDETRSIRSSFPNDLCFCQSSKKLKDCCGKKIFK